MLKEKTWIVDFETDGFDASKFHCMSVINNLEDGPFSTTDYDVMRKFLTENDTFIMHNGQRSDVIWIEDILGVSLEDKRIIDTLPLSWALFPDLDKHGLYDWGTRLNIPKVEILDWVSLPPEKYIERCEQDVRINLALWDIILGKLSRLYSNMDDLNRYIDYLSFKMYSARLAEENRWKVDLRHVHESLVELHGERDKRIEELARAMPKVPIMGSRSAPKRMHNKSGELTKLGETWFDQLTTLGLPSDTQEIEFIKGYEDPNPGSNPQIKAWLDSLGWIPETFKEVKDKDGIKKQIPQINKEKQKGGGVCESIKKLFEKEPALHSLDGLSILNHRIPILSSFISHSDNGYLCARIAGLTNTLRFKHAELTNLPKTNLPYAEAVRGSLISREGNTLIGADLSNLEDRTKQHFIWPHDPEYVQSMMSPDWDAHLDIAVVAEMMTSEDAEAYKKGDKSKKPIRDIAKNGNFAAVYGAGAPRLATTMGIPLKRAKAFKEAYNKRNWSVKVISEEQKVKYIGEETWLLNPVSRFWYSLREVKDIFSTLNQGTASYVFDLWLRYILDEYDFLIGQFHDELILECKDNPKEIERIKTIINDSIKAVNDQLKLNRDMDCDIQVAHRYSEVH